MCMMFQGRGNRGHATKRRWVIDMKSYIFQPGPENRQVRNPLARSVQNKQENTRDLQGERVTKGAQDFVLKG